MYLYGKAEYSQHNFRSRKSNVSLFFGLCGVVEIGYVLSGTFLLISFAFLYLLLTYSMKINSRYILHKVSNILRLCLRTLK